MLNEQYFVLSFICSDYIEHLIVFKINFEEIKTTHNSFTHVRWVKFLNFLMVE